MPAGGVSVARPARRGSALSDKQVAQSVRRGQRVTAWLTGSGQIEGYIYGTDDYHWALVSPHGECYLIHKASCHLGFGPEGSYAEEERHEELERLVAPYRDWLERVHFGHQAADDAGTG